MDDAGGMSLLSISGEGSDVGGSLGKHWHLTLVAQGVVVSAVVEAGPGW